MQNEAKSLIPKLWGINLRKMRRLSRDNFVGIMNVCYFLMLTIGKSPGKTSAPTAFLQILMRGHKEVNFFSRADSNAV